MAKGVWFSVDRKVCLLRVDGGREKKIERERKEKHTSRKGSRHASGKYRAFTWARLRVWRFAAWVRVELEKPMPLAHLTKVTSCSAVANESSSRSSPPHRFGCERFPIWSDSGTDDATMLCCSGVNYQTHHTRCLLCFASRCTPAFSLVCVAQLWFGK